MDPSSSAEDLHSGDSTPSSQPSTPEATPAKPPSLPLSSGNTAYTMTPSSAPLGPITAARRPGPAPKVTALNADMAAKLRDLAARRGSSQPNIRQGAVNGQSNSPGPMQNKGSVGGSVTGGSIPTGGSFPGGMKLPLGMPRPSAPTWNATPGKTMASPRMNPRGPIGGLGAKRGLTGGMKLSEAHKSPTADDAPSEQKTDTGSQFNRYSNIVDVQKGTLNFKNKAVVHSGGIDFGEGKTFFISLDEVDTISELGKGNYGTVFKVRHSRPKLRVPGQGLRGNMSRSREDDDESYQASSKTTGLIMAMKELRLELEDSKFAQIIMELDILHKCSESPFIIDFYGAFFQEGSVYICIEYMDGGSIDKIYGDGVPEGVLKKMTLSTVMGLKYLKDEHNIIHRDVKPTNILVNTRGQVKICDFGVSGNLVASIARTNIGCQSYMAPERISGGGMAQTGAANSGSYSVQSDIWSLGLSIIECALGRYPYPPETYDNIFSQLSAIVDGEPPGLPADHYSEAARDFVQGCLNKVPKMRPTYAALIRHAWLSPLMKIPTISEDEEAERIAEAGGDADSSVESAIPTTADKEVAEWVMSALEKKRAGKLGESVKPALHAAPLDAVAATSPPVDTSSTKSIATPNPGIRVESPELVIEKVSSLDFASGVGPGSS